MEDGHWNTHIIGLRPSLKTLGWPCSAGTTYVITVEAYYPEVAVLIAEYILYAYRSVIC